MMTSPCPARKAIKKGMTSGSGQHIKVFVRVRPMNKIEKECKAHCMVECPTNKEVIVQERTNDKISKKFTFDKVFHPDSKQADIYRAVAKPLVDEVLNGFNCTIFAYGQTGTGKTYTMEGDGQLLMEDNPSSGIIPRCVTHLFDELRCQKLEFTMRVSFLELYNEELFDLLSAHDDLSKLRIYEDGARKGSCIIQGLEEVLVRCKADVYNIIEKGSAKRQTAATMLNAHSSRSHTVFTVTVHIKENVLDGDELLKTGKLHLVDLAGSENIGRSGAVDKRAREAGNINQSLLTLGRVITSLVEKAPHIPYRESKLTRLLQDALGGRTKTSIIATISPAHINLEETLSTLDYAHRAKNIQNKPEVNQKLNKKELIGEYTIEIDRLRRDLLAMREKNGVYLANENYQEMISTQEQQEHEIAEKIAQIRALEEEIEKNMEIFNDINKKLTETTEKLSTTETSLLSTKHTLECTQKLLSQTAAEKEEQKYLVKAHCKVEEKLHNEGKNLINTALLASSDVYKLHDKLDRKRKVECLNSEIEKSFNEEHNEKISQMELTLMEMKSHNQENIKVISEDIKTCVTKTQDELKKILTKEKQISNNSSEECQILKTKVHFMLDKLTNFEDLDNLCKKCDNEKGSLNSFKDDAFNPRILQITECVVQHSNDITDLKEYVDEKVTTVKKQCQNVYEEHSTVIANIETEVQKMIELEEVETKTLQSRNQKEEEKINVELNINNEILFQVESQMGQMKSEMKVQMDQIKDQMKVKMDAIKLCMQEMENQQSMQFDNMNMLWETKFQEMNTLLQQIRFNQSSRKDRMLKNLQHMSKEKEKKNINVETLSKNIQSNNSNLSALSIEHCKLSEKCVEEIKRYVNNKIVKLESQINSFEEDRQFIAAQVCSQIETVLGTLSDAESFASTHISNVIKTVELVKEESNELLNTFNCKLSSDLNHQHECLSNEQCRLALSIEDICQRLLDHELYIREKLYNHHSEVIHCGEKVKEFLSEQLVKDIATGMTPARKEYCFSKILPRTSPHEKLLERHRTLVRGGSKIPLPSFSQDYDYDIDNNINTSSDSNPQVSSSFNSERVGSNSNLTTGNISQPLARSESFKDFVFQEPSAPVMAYQENMENIMKYYPLLRSSSTSSLDSKENYELNSLRQNQSGSLKKKELRMPSSSKLQNSDKNVNNEIKPRKILGSHN